MGIQITYSDFAIFRFSAWSFLAAQSKSLAPLRFYSRVFNYSPRLTDSRSSRVVQLDHLQNGRPTGGRLVARENIRFNRFPQDDFASELSFRIINQSKPSVPSISSAHADIATIRKPRTCTDTRKAANALGPQLTRLHVSHNRYNGGGHGSCVGWRIGRSHCRGR